MKVFLHYEDNTSPFLHKTLKITLPKSWKKGPTSKLLNQFVETYNASDLGNSNLLDPSDLHLALKLESKNKGKKSKSKGKKSDDEITVVPLASDATTLDVIDDRDAVYIIHGPSKTLAEMGQEKQDEIDEKKERLANTVACIHFGCNNRFPKEGPYPKCCYHAAPPVFHETAKFWSCCPQKKAYDWDEFQAIPGCLTGFCTNVKEENDTKQFLGGCDLREAVGEAQKLKSIDDFNAAQAGGSNAVPVLDRLKSVMEEIGVEKELFDQVFEGIKKDVGAATGSEDEIAAATQELGSKIKAAMKEIAVQQLRIK